MLEISQRELDGNEYLLNTPSLTYDLRKGLDGSQVHNPGDFITKQTLVDPDIVRKELWDRALDTFFLDDEALIEYVQRIVGLAAIGKVFIEALIIAYGEGRNGKSTFWNVVARVLGSYSGTMSAETLTIGCRRNVRPELAEAYLLVGALAEFGDDDAAHVLAEAAASTRGGGVLVLEDPHTDETDDEHELEHDLELLAVHGGALRTESRLDALAEAAGLRPGGREIVGWGRALRRYERV